METAHGEETRKALNFIENILVEGDIFQLQVLLSLAEFYNFRRSNFFLINKNEQLVNPVFLNIDERNLTSYHSYYYKDDCFHPQKALNEYFKKTVVSIDDLVAKDKFHNSEYYRDFLKKQEIHDQISVGLFDDGQIIGLMSFFKEKRERFSVIEIQTLKLLANSIAGILSKNLAHERTLSEKTMYQQCATHSPFGILIFDEQLNVIYTNAKIKEMMALFAEKQISSAGFLHDIIGKVGEKWDQGVLKHLISPGLNEFTVSINPISLLVDKQTFMLSLIPENVYKKKMSEQKISNEYGLSKRELEIIPLVLKGFSNEEIGKELFITEHTVKTHIRNIFKKFKVNNRTSLCYKINLTKQRFR